MPDSPDPLMVALQSELGQYAPALDSLSEDEQFLWSIGRSLSNRHAEIADLKGQIDVAQRRIIAVQNNIVRIEQWKRSDIRYAVAGMLKLRTGPPCKSVKVPGMQFGTKHVDAKIEWDSEYTPDIVEWAEANCPEAIVRSEPVTPAPKPDKDALLAYRKRTGQTPKHCTYILGGDVPYARPLKGKEDE